jgi:hypothetical protein
MQHSLHIEAQPEQSDLNELHAVVTGISVGQRFSCRSSMYMQEGDP